MSAPVLSTGAVLVDVRCGASRPGNADPCKHLLARYAPGLNGTIELWCSKCRAARTARFFGPQRTREVST